VLGPHPGGLGATLGDGGRTSCLLLFLQYLLINLFGVQVVCSVRGLERGKCTRLPA
jgi:hypothetical protein